MDTEICNLIGFEVWEGEGYADTRQFWHEHDTVIEAPDDELTD